MADLQVTCINKQPRHNPYDGITHLGGFGWRDTRADVVRKIRNGTNSYYTLVNGNRGNISIVKGENGDYLRTHADGKWNDNLLALPECK